MLEKGLQAQFDKVIMVLAPVESRESRLLERGLSKPDITARMRNQVSDQERKEAADFILVNDGSLAQLRSQVEQVWQAISA